MKKRGISFLLSLLLALTRAAPALAVGNGGAIVGQSTLSGDYYVKTDGTL